MGASLSAWFSAVVHVAQKDSHLNVDVEYTALETRLSRKWCYKNKCCFSAVAQSTAVIRGRSLSCKTLPSLSLQIFSHA